MSEAKCQHKAAPHGAKFCPECGSLLERAPQKPDVQVQISQQAEKVGSGEMVGMKVGEIKGAVTVVQGNVIHIHNPSAELMGQLGAVKAVSTEVMTEQSKRRRPGDERIDALEKNVSEILKQMRTAEQRGQHVDEVQVGTMHLSRVELLLKQAVLLTAEADQMYLDHIEHNKKFIEQSKRSRRVELDLSDLLDGFDGQAHTAKLREAYETLREANAIEPTNAEVLLHMAKVMDQLEENPQEISGALYKVQNLLTPPRNDRDKFHLAQAAFLSATLREYQHDEQLRSARNLFLQLGRNDWVQQCDDLLAANDLSGYSATPETGFGTQGTPQPSSFQPVGNWQSQLSNGSTMTFQLLPGGQMQGVQQVGMLGINVNFNGQWAFDPYDHLLQLQGMVGGSSPFLLHIAIEGHQGNIYFGMGSDGQSYLLTKS